MYIPNYATISWDSGPPNSANGTYMRTLALKSGRHLYCFYEYCYSLNYTAHISHYFLRITFFMSDIICYSQKIFLARLRLEVKVLREDSLHPLTICSSVIFGPFHSFDQKLSIFCALFLIFHSAPFLRSNMLMSLLQDMWRSVTLNLGCLRSLLSHNILVDIILFTQTKKSTDSASSFRPQEMRHSSIHEAELIFLPSL